MPKTPASPASSASPASPASLAYGVHGTKTRKEQVQVRLVPSALGRSIQVTLTGAERQALEQAAKDHTPGGLLSPFLRDLAANTASHLHARALEEVPADLRVQWVIETAAGELAMLPGEYMRWIALEAIGYTNALQQAQAARQTLKNRVLCKDEYGDPIPSCSEKEGTPAA